MMTGCARHRCLNDFARDVEVSDRMLLSEGTAIAEQQGHVSGTATQNEIKQMKRASFLCLFPSAAVSLKLMRCLATLFFPLTGHAMMFYCVKVLMFSEWTQRNGNDEDTNNSISLKGSFFTYFSTKLVDPSVIWHGNSHVFHMLLL